MPFLVIAHYPSSFDQESILHNRLLYSEIGIADGYKYHGRRDVQDMEDDHESEVDTGDRLTPHLSVMFIRCLLMHHFNQLAEKKNKLRLFATSFNRLYRLDGCQ